MHSPLMKRFYMQSESMKRILMTGSTGFVGHNVLPILKENHLYDIHTPIDTNINNKISVVIDTNFHPADIDVFNAAV